jgi:hypothetical protein
VAAKVASGLRIVDPQEGIDSLRSQPCINPDFIAALEKTQQLLSQGNPVGAMTADKYPDGRYIPAFVNGNCSRQAAAAIPDSEVVVLGITCKVHYQPDKGLNLDTILIDFENVQLSGDGIGGVFDSQGMLVSVNKWSAGGRGIRISGTLKPGTYTFKAYRGVGCCTYYNDGRRTFGMLTPPFKEFADLRRLPATASFTFDVRNGYQTMIVDR